MKRRIILIGPPACGKGTFSRMIVDAYGYPATSTGAIFRAEKGGGTALGLRVHQLTSKGQLAPDEAVIDLVRAWLDTLPAPADAFVLDGFPRTLPQAEWFEMYLAQRGTPLDLALLLELDHAEIERRILNRRVCTSCRYTGSLGWDIAAEGDPCPKCGGVLEQRADDSLPVLEKRLELYARFTLPLIPFYESRELLCRLDASLPRAEAMSRIQSLLGSPRSPRLIPGT